MNLVEDHPVIISTMLQFHRLSSFWQEDFQSFNQSEHIIGPGSHVGFPICTKITNLVENLPMNISAKFGPNLFSGFREEDENMKSLQTRTTPSTDAKWWQKLTWLFGPGELKTGLGKTNITRYDYNLTIMESPKPATDNRFKK
jgi:hypothetical protein